MAFYDNKLWLLSHIHNSFISSDDTGVCEMVMGGGGFRDELELVARTHGLTAYLPDVLAGEEEEQHQGSPDIEPGPGRRADRLAPRLPPAPARDPGPAARTVLWKAGEAEAAAELFPRREVARHPQARPESGLARRLAARRPGDSSRWQEFARWEGQHWPPAAQRALQVFPVLEGEEEPGPALDISVGREAKVREVVGLVCWRYTQEARQPPLEAAGPEGFDLFMCEEDGSVDRDFPCLDSRESFAKYGFQQLALVPRDPGGGSAPGGHRVTLHLPDGSFTELGVERDLLTLGDLLQLGLQKRRRALPDTPLRYHLEAADSAGVALEPGAALADHQGNEFYIVRSNSKRPSGPRDPAGGDHLNIYEVHLFQSFDVQMITKVRTKVDIHLGISGEKVEIDPKPQASWTVYKQKAATYEMEAVVSCEVVGRGGEDRLTVRLVHLADSGWRWVEFEGSRAAVEAVVDKVNHLLEMRQTPARKQRKEYLENKEKKKGRSRLSSKI